MKEKPVVGYRKTYLRGKSSEVLRLLDALPPYFGVTWERDTQSEERSLGMPFEDTVYRCYHFKGNDELPAARLWLMIQNTVTEIINIVPETPRSWWHGGLSPAEYSGILDDFLQLTKQAQAVTSFAVQADIMPAERSLDTVLPSETASLFKTFALVANPATGNLHPLDAQRWYAFVISAHRHRVEADLEFLRQWLALNTEWYEDAIERVLTETESALELLNVYDGHRSAA